MRIKDVKTEQDFWLFADNWYQRAHLLREVWQNPRESDERRAKAFRLWFVMKDRVLNLSLIATRIQVRKNVHFEKGGVTK